MGKELLSLISAEVALYPLESGQADQVINNCISALDGANLSYDVGPVSTYITGDAQSVWQGLQDLFDMALEQSGEVSMVVTITNARV
ncbi:MAG: YkoF family thiamine/hydroxymethylpyrimidine-binding protein [Limnochordia bacterium]